MRRVARRHQVINFAKKQLIAFRFFIESNVVGHVTKKFNTHSYRERLNRVSFQRQSSALSRNICLSTSAHTFL
jgi:hypothetical protein